MKIWLDAQLSPAMAFWISAEFRVSVVAVRDLGYREARNQEIFSAARQAGAVVMTKDRDFVRLVEDFPAHLRSSGSRVATLPTLD